MATPMTAAQRVAALRAEGLTIVQHPGWETHDRNHKGPWGPVRGALIHHTAGTAPGDADIVWSGRSDLPGPCAHDYLAPSGVVTMMSAGRANHAGGGSPAVLDAVTSEDYGDRPPAPTHHDGSDGAADGNQSFYGLEASNRGAPNTPWPPVQYDAAVRWAAAICRFHGWSAKSAIGHKEWSDWKPDPRFDMVRFRADVAERLQHPASWSPDDDTPTNPEEPPMALTQAELDKIALSVHSYKGKLPSGKVDPLDAYAYLRNTAAAVAGLNTKLGAIAEKIAELQAVGLTEVQIEAIAVRVADLTAPRVADVLAARLTK